MAVYKYLDASTKYVTEDDVKRLKNPEPGLPVWAYQYQEGFFIRYSEDVDYSKTYGFSPAFWMLISRAQQEGCLLIRLDADGDDDIAGLPEFQW